MLIQCDEPMSRHLSWRAGGRVARACFPGDANELMSFFATLRHDEPILVVGLGSNLLVRDGGFDGTAVFTHRCLSKLEIEADGAIYAEAGVAAPKIARFAANHGLCGAEFLAGIPGTIGGALAMNAGCFGAQTWSFVDKVLMLNRKGVVRERSFEDFAIAYRHVGLKTGSDEMFFAVRLRFEPGSVLSARSRIRDLLAKRVASQPLKLPNAGSVFCNPPGDYAARLIEAAGLKGSNLGVTKTARVSEHHANFIVNPGGRDSATAIEKLMTAIQEQVHYKSGVLLTREVRICGSIQ